MLIARINTLPAEVTVTLGAFGIVLPCAIVGRGGVGGGVVCEDGVWGETSGAARVGLGNNIAARVWLGVGERGGVLQMAEGRLECSCLDFAVGMGAPFVGCSLSYVAGWLGRIWLG